MFLSTLNTLMKLKNINPAELARRAGISRQAISKWFTSAETMNKNLINAEWNTILKISEALHIKPSALSTDLFRSLSPETKSQYHSLLLWDQLYDSVESLSIALAKKEYKAVGRYVQVFGILAAEKIFGSWIYLRFDQYSPFIHPVKRKELKKLCQTLQEQNLI